MNNHGSALLTAMISALTVGIVSAVILQQSQITEKQSRTPRIKSAMSMLEAQLMESANQGQLMKPCDPATTDPLCLQLDSTKLNAMATIIPGAQCPTGVTQCGLRIENENFVFSTKQFTAQIVYEGSEVVVAPINVNFIADMREAWASQNSNCPASQPLLIGFDSIGTPICRALPTACPAGEYVNQVDPMSLTSGGVICVPFPANISCPNAGDILTSFSWTGGSGGIAFSCLPPLNPFMPSALSDPTSYEYASMTPPVTSSWPVTTTSSTTTTTTTTTVPVTPTTLPMCAPPPGNPGAPVLIGQQTCSKGAMNGSYTCRTPFAAGSNNIFGQTGLTSDGYLEATWDWNGVIYTARLTFASTNNASTTSYPGVGWSCVGPNGAGNMTCNSGGHSFSGRVPPGYGLGGVHVQTSTTGASGGIRTQGGPFTNPCP